MAKARFENRKALVTGGANGMGRACVSQLAAEGADVHVIDKDQGAIEGLVEELTSIGHRVSGSLAEVTDEDAFTQAFQKMLEAFDGRLDIMIHIAGASRGGLLAEQTTADWDWHYRVNLRSHVIGCKLASEAMRQRRSGAIVCMSSISGLRGDPGWAAYNATKAAIKSLTQSLAWELGRDGIRVNAVCPGPVSSERMLRSMDGEAAAMIEDYKRHTALNRLVDPQEAADAILFLASDASAAITGHALVVDCGLTCTTGQPIQDSVFDAG